MSQDLSSQQQETDILADILPPAPLPEMTSQQNISAPAFGQPSPSFSASSGQMASPFSEPTGQLTQQGFSAATSQLVQPLPTGQLTQQAFSTPNAQSVQVHSSFSAPTSQYGQPPLPSHSGQPGLHAFSSSTGQSMQPTFASHGGQSAQPSGHTYGGLHSQDRSLAPGAPNIYSQSQNGYNGPVNSGNFLPQGSTSAFPSHMAPQAPTAQLSQLNSQSFFGQQGNAAPFSSPITHQPAAPNASHYAVSTGSNALVSQPSKDKFETKSTVWADTLSRGLVNLNISGRECLYLLITRCL